MLSKSNHDNLLQQELLSRALQSAPRPYARIIFRNHRVSLSPLLPLCVLLFSVFVVKVSLKFLNFFNANVLTHTSALLDNSWLLQALMSLNKSIDF